MIYRIYGRRNDEFNILVTEATYERVARLKGANDTVEMYDLDSPGLAHLSPPERVMYTPIIDLLDDGGELVETLENKFFYNIKEARVDSPMSDAWWRQLDRFLGQAEDHV